MEEAVALSKEVGEEVARRYNLPVFLYEKSASAPTGKTWQLSVKESSRVWQKR